MRPAASIRAKAVAADVSAPRATAAARWQFVAAAILMALGVALRWPTVLYTGSLDQGGFNNHIFRYIGAYSDISSLYFRDQLWYHPVPYFDYRVEYPVGMSILIYLIGFFKTNVSVYLFSTAAVMFVAGLATISLLQLYRGANVWLLALSPTLALYVVLNWDMACVLLLAAALLLFQRDHDRWGALLLAAAVWTKFFPVVVLPLVLLERVLQRRWHDALWIGGIFGLASVLINAPFAIQWGDNGLQLRENWLWFFEFNRTRAPEVNIWTIFQGLGMTNEQITSSSGLLAGLGIAAIMALMVLQHARGGNNLVLPATLAALAWFFFINKVYSPQYSLWLALLLALLAAPPALAVFFGSVDSTLR